MSQIGGSLDHIGQAKSFVQQARERAFASRRTLINAAIIIGGFALYLAFGAASYFAIADWLPTQTPFKLLGHSIDLRAWGNRMIGNTTEYSIILSLVPSILVIETLAVGWKNSSVGKLINDLSPSMKTDFLYFFLVQMHVMYFVGRLMFFGLSIVTGLAVRDWLIKNTGFNFSMNNQSPAVKYVLCFIFYTFFDYWKHRLDHSKFFWPLHRYHHSAEEFCVLTTAREHPLNVSSALIVNIPMGVLGITPEDLVVITIAINALGFFWHSQIRSDWGWFGKLAIQSPIHHRLHHKLDMTHPTGHYGITPIWDHIFGTWSTDKSKTFEIGVSEPYRHGFWVLPDLFRDYWDFCTGFFWEAKPQAAKPTVAEPANDIGEGVQPVVQPLLVA